MIINVKTYETKKGKTGQRMVSVVPKEHMMLIKPWQTVQYRIESWLAYNGWPLYNYDLTNQTEALTTSMDRSKLSFKHLPDQSVEVTYDGEFVQRRG